MKKLSRRDFLRTAGTAAAGLAAVNLIGCAPAKPTAAAEQNPGTSASANDKLFLNYWTGWSGTEFDALQLAVDKHNKEFPNAFVNMTTVFGQYEKVLTAIAGGNPPDIVSAVWLHQLVSMAGRDGLTPLTNYASTSNMTGKEYWPNVWDAWHWKGDLWGIAITVNASTFAYRRDIFKEVGLDPDKAPKTMGELEDANLKLEKMDDKGNIARVGMIPGGIFGWAYVYGGDWYDEKTNKITADKEQNVAALDMIGAYYKRLGTDKIMAFQTGFGDFMSANNPFMAGLQSIYGCGEWMIQFINKFAPDTDYAYMAYPSPDGGRENTTTFDGSVFTIPKGAKHPDASWDFITWLNKDENMTEIDYAFQNIPTKISVANSEKFMSDPKFKFNVDLYTGKNTFGPPKLPVTDTLFTKLAEAEGFVTRGEKTAAQALKDVQTEVQAELDSVSK